MCILLILLFSKETGLGVFLVLPLTVNGSGPISTIGYDRRGWMPDEHCRV